VAAKINKQAKILAINGGGVTFSGGEVLLQSDFVLAVRKLLPDVHALIETSGFASEETFTKLCEAMDMVIMDVKIVDPELHKRYTGVDNAPILHNLQILKRMNKPFRIRVPLIPTVNDTPDNMEATAALLENAPLLEKVELMRYNKAAGAKYSGVGMEYAPDFPEQQDPCIITEPFERRGIRVEIL
jgi:pyruvate formate lyase activating enzyme